MRTVAVVGKNFGDEGKGLAVDFLSLNSCKALVVRHNGGAQSGHTVQLRGEIPAEKGGTCEEKRFVFHELSSGSIRHAGTLWIDSFYPDLYKLGEEMSDFFEEFGFVPEIYAMEGTCVTIPDDVLLNMALESSRGSDRHGSCGMGINECDIRTGAGFGLSLREISDMDSEGLYRRLTEIRKNHTAMRLREISNGLTAQASGYIELLRNENVLGNAAETMVENFKHIKLLSDAELKHLLDDVDTLIFESGQGLLLDCDNERFMPHVTASKTGIYNPCRFLKRLGLHLDEVIYISRAYVTRHGAGELPCECCRERLGMIQKDRTNEPNEWQGHIRYGTHVDEEDFVTSIRDDMIKNSYNKLKVSLLLTHLNETENMILFKDRNMTISEFRESPPIKGLFFNIYLSDTPYAEDVTKVASN